MDTEKNRVVIEAIGELPEGVYNHGVPLHPEVDSILLGDTQRQGRNARIELTKDSDSASLKRTDGEPMQISILHTIDNVQLGNPLLLPVRGLRHVLASPQSELLVVRENNSWVLTTLLKDIRTGEKDINKFFRKIAHVSLAKIVRNKQNVDNQA